MAHTCMHGDILTDRHNLHHYQLRNDERIPLLSTTHSQLFIRYRAIKTWNSLPGDLRSASFLSSFRTDAPSTSGTMQLNNK